MLIAIVVIRGAMGGRLPDDGSGQYSWSVLSGETMGHYFLLLVSRENANREIPEPETGRHHAGLACGGAVLL